MTQFRIGTRGSPLALAQARMTRAALVAAGQSEQVPFHLGRAMDNGLTRDEASEALTQLAFYAGWPPVFSAMPVFRSVCDGRAGE